MIIPLILFLVILSFLVLIHELGHFISAKKNGIRVDEFGIGFPPKLFGIKRGETEYTVNALPLGGFVRLFGEEYGEVKDPNSKSRAFAYKKPHQKALVVAAGVIINLLFGVALMYGLLMTQGYKSDPLPLLFPHTFKFGIQEGRVMATHLVKGSPAEKAGILPEDIISSYAINDSTTSKNISSAQELIQIIKSSSGKSVHLQTVNAKNGTTKTVTVVPEYNKELKRAIIGVNLIDALVLSYQAPHEKVLSGFLHSYNVLEYNYAAVAELVGISFKQKSAAPVSSAVSGPIGIYTVVQDMVKTSGAQLARNIINLMALLSLSLGVMNILPFPALDGGRMVFVIYEWVTKKQVDKRVENITNLVGFVMLMGLAVLVSINDILRLIK